MIGQLPPFNIIANLIPSDLEEYLLSSGSLADFKANQWANCPELCWAIFWVSCKGSSEQVECQSCKEKDEITERNILTESLNKMNQELIVLLGSTSSSKDKLIEEKEKTIKELNLSERSANNSEICIVKKKKTIIEKDNKIA